MANPAANPAANATAVGVIDMIEDDRGRVTVAPNDGHIVLVGWALDAGAQPFAAVEVEVGGARASGPCIGARADVAARYGSPAQVGFRVELALDDAALGRHAVALRGRRADGSHVQIPLAVPLDVVPPLGRLPAGVVPGALVGFVDEVGTEGGGSSDGKAPMIVPTGSVVVLRGWAASPEGVPAHLAYAQIDGQRYVRGMSGYPRPDAGAQFNAGSVGYGFRFRIAADVLGPGEHSLRVYAIAGNTVASVGHELRVTVGPRERPRVFESSHRMRGRVDLVGRLDGDTTVVEERSYLRMRANERVVVTGWAGDPVSKVLPDRVVLVVDDVAHGPVQRGIERDDVVAETQCERLRTSGFSAVVRADDLAAGFHRAELVALYGGEPVVFDAFSFEIIP